MNLLADEGVDKQIVVRLREEGYSSATLLKWRRVFPMMSYLNWPIKRDLYGSVPLSPKNIVEGCLEIWITFDHNRNYGKFEDRYSQLCRQGKIPGAIEAFIDQPVVKVLGLINQDC